MRYFLLFSFSLFILSACNPNDPSPLVDDKAQEIQVTYRVLALGDSLTEGLGVAQKDNYPSQLQRLLPKHVEVINAGLSGETSSGLLNRLDWVLKQKPDLTILTIGANDAMRGLPLDLTKQNIDDAIKRIEQSGSKVILAGMQIYDNLGSDYVTEFKEIYPQLAQKHQVVLIPFFLQHIAGDSKYNQNDGIHPTAAGYKIIIEKNILPAVLPFLEHL